MHCLYVPVKLLGPLKKTLVDYWRLIWQERPCVVIMVTNLIETGKNKCEQYWPSTTSLDVSFGPFHVSLIEEQAFPDSVRRVITVTVSLL